MTALGFEKAIQSAAASDQVMLDLLVEMLMESQDAKRVLRDKGYGVTGTPLLQMVQEVPDCG